jgi:hypothetical protein
MKELIVFLLLLGGGRVDRTLLGEERALFFLSKDRNRITKSNWSTKAW